MKTVTRRQGVKGSRVDATVDDVHTTVVSTGDGDRVHEPVAATQFLASDGVAVLEGYGSNLGDHTFLFPLYAIAWVNGLAIAWVNGLFDEIELLK